MEKLFWIFFLNFEKMVKITQQSTESESKTNTLLSLLKSYETLK
jgi:hypothetical protein